MPELQCVTEPIIRDAQPVPFIEREGDSVKGRHQYGAYILPKGGELTVEVKLDGRLLETLGPYRVTAQDGKNALVDVRLRVSDDCDQSNFTESV